LLGGDKINISREQATRLVLIAAQITQQVQLDIQADAEERERKLVLLAKMEETAAESQARVDTAKQALEEAKQALQEEEDKLAAATHDVVENKRCRDSLDDESEPPAKKAQRGLLSGKEDRMADHTLQEALEAAAAATAREAAAHKMALEANQKELQATQDTKDAQQKVLEAQEAKKLKDEAGKVKLQKAAAMLQKAGVQSTNLVMHKSLQGART
jgi:hypothetical protein